MWGNVLIVVCADGQSLHVALKLLFRPVITSQAPRDARCLELAQDALHARAIRNNRRPSEFSAPLHALHGVRHQARVGLDHCCPLDLRAPAVHCRRRRGGLVGASINKIFRQCSWMRDSFLREDVRRNLRPGKPKIGFWDLCEGYRTNRKGVGGRGCWEYTDGKDGFERET
jgi:hypothetical protein